MRVVWYGPEPRAYVDPVEIVRAHALDDVAPALERLDAALDAGLSVAGYVAYEAGLAFVPAHRRPPSAFAGPFVCCGVFRGAAPAPERAGGHARTGPLVAQVERDEYDAAIARVLAGIADGDVYQVNVTAPFAFSFEGSAWDVFASLRRVASVGYAAFVEVDGRAVASLSPESFVRVDGTRVRMRPMKGTSEPSAVADLARPKNRAEHVMIVDLLRNDLHRLARRVDAPALFEIERYPTFATMTSTLDAVTDVPVRLASLFAATFPSGSITGAPKLAAMTRIAAVERGARDVAMGAIGYCDPPGRGEWSVAIRTAVLDERSGRGSVRIGGGVVADSTARREWAEILVKRRTFEALAVSAGLIETVRVREDGSLVRRDAHLARLERSAFALGIPLDLDDVACGMAAESARSRTERLLRVEVARDGTVRCTSRPFDPWPAPVRICVTDARVRSSDPALRHKTTLRDAYDRARAEARASGCDEGILLDEAGRVADGSRTTVLVVRDGAYVTPPLANGALDGVLRAELLRSGAAIEGTLYARDLHATPLFCASSARGVLACTLVASKGALSALPATLPTMTGHRSC